MKEKIDDYDEEDNKTIFKEEVNLIPSRTISNDDSLIVYVPEKGNGIFILGKEGAEIEKTCETIVNFTKFIDPTALKETPTFDMQSIDKIVQNKKLGNIYSSYTNAVNITSILPRTMQLFFDENCTYQLLSFFKGCTPDYLLYATGTFTDIRQQSSIYGKHAFRDPELYDIITIDNIQPGDIVFPLQDQNNNKNINQLFIFIDENLSVAVNPQHSNQSEFKPISIRHTNTLLDEFRCLANVLKTGEGITIYRRKKDLTLPDTLVEALLNFYHVIAAPKLLEKKLLDFKKALNNFCDSFEEHLKNLSEEQAKSVPYMKMCQSIAKEIEDKVNDGFSEFKLGYYSNLIQNNKKQYPSILKLGKLCFTQVNDTVIMESLEEQHKRYQTTFQDNTIQKVEELIRGLETRGTFGVTKKVTAIRTALEEFKKINVDVFDIESCIENFTEYKMLLKALAARRQWFGAVLKPARLNENELDVHDAKKHSTTLRDFFK